ncbi:MOSC domain-containing protein [Rhodococcus opacus]|uniref:MOSC domain-containing protein n=2 Tax=Rhodococcus opacus TaxID=37919 RepID=A0AAX3YKJ0_RHOOP|nr:MULTISPECIES: MOSC domain-containing protein [Rhodococcus]NDV03134.1 MOSC domain-containing protein [Rhodococcus sp. IEGM 248]NHU44604.1 MOSC domain-containing protein [Rhodococcus sp. A14]MBA8958741.1 MOSC domain-containing protein YiiM [Rhodococcus opacus]MBP2204306.1 MOSC domain-containing protein YiiM [Rhodococcus opacus]MCZ4585182.1 MOSC domain-containing protein [Rhodococcus opacus]
MSEATATAGEVLAVCVLHTERDSGTRRVTRTAIDKRPVDGPVRVTTAGLVGDHVCDTEYHGGPFKAVYAYQEDEAQRWASELGRELPPGWFGENLRLDGIAATDAVIGERWRIGTTELEVTSPRTPCGTFGVWAAEPRWVKRFSERADTGAYLRVVTEGSVTAGDTVQRIHVPGHGVTVRDLFTGRDPERFVALLEQQENLSPTVADKARRRIAGLEVQVTY